MSLLGRLPYLKQTLKDKFSILQLKPCFKIVSDIIQWLRLFFRHAAGVVCILSVVLCSRGILGYTIQVVCLQLAKVHYRHQLGWSFYYSSSQRKAFGKKWSTVLQRMVKHLLESIFCSDFCVSISVNTPDHLVSFTSL